MKPIALPLAVIALLLGLAPGAAHAHSMVISSTPADNATLAPSPARIDVMFDAPMRIVSVTLRGEDGTEYAVSPVGGRAASDHLVVEPPRLPAGDYRLEWRGLSGDGHSVSEDLSFRVAER